MRNRLLLVDDEPNILHALRRLLRKENYELFLASSGAEALQQLEHNEVDLVISDGRMPGMSGIELLKQIRAEHPDTVRIILSGYTDVEQLAGAINEGEAYRFILKPWNDEELKLAIRHALEHHRLMKENEQLVEHIKRQNEELRQLNENLELAVDQKTQELQLHNRVLMAAKEMLDELPLAVFGIDENGTIVQINKEAQASLLGKACCVGCCIDEALPEEISQAVHETIATGIARRVEGEWACGEENVLCHPLKHQNEIRGAVIVSCWNSGKLPQEEKHAPDDIRDRSKQSR